MSDEIRRFPRSVFSRGSEPDVRFSLANERTFLAWTRTALALIAGGVALEVLGLDLQPSFRLTASLLLVAAGTVMPVASWFDWARTERALRLSNPLPHSLLGVFASGVVVVAGGLILAAMVVQ